MIISAFGSDRSGIVSELSGIITSHGGNIEDSRMTRLGSDFAIIMLISVAHDWQESMEVALQAVNGLTIITKPTNKQEISEGVKYQIDLSGADNEGIVKVLSKYLAGKSINILELKTNISNAPVTGAPLFNLEATTAVPENLNILDIQSGLNQIAHKLGIEITINQSEYSIKTA